MRYDVYAVASRAVRAQQMQRGINLSAAARWGHDVVGRGCALPPEAPLGLAGEDGAPAAIERRPGEVVLIDQAQRERFDPLAAGVAAGRRDRVERDKGLGHIERAHEQLDPRS